MDALPHDPRSGAGTHDGTTTGPRARRVQVLVSEDDELVVAWVGRGESGLLVSFDPEEFVPIAAGEPGAGFATGCAIGWYLDCSINIRKPAIGSPRVVKGPRAGVPAPSRYWPTPSFTSQRHSVPGFSGTNADRDTPKPSLSISARTPR